jgi:type III secretion protein U
MSDTEAKTKPASPRKLRKLRQEGMIASALEAVGFVAVAVGVVTLFLVAGGIFVALMDLFDIAEDAMLLRFDDAVRAAAGDSAMRLFQVVAPVAAATVLTAIVVAIVSNGGIPLSAKPLAPQMERISPINGLKRIYGRRGWIETAASFGRVFLWLTFAALVGWALLPRFAGAVQCGFPCQAQAARPIFWVLGIGLVVLLLFSAWIDIILQRALFLAEQRMTATEVRQERREAFGDPQIRSERRKRMREEPADLTAVGVDRANICFYSGDRAIAVRFHPEQARVPRVTAKLRGAEAQLFRMRLAKAGLPIAESRAIVAACQAVQPGDALPMGLYELFASTLRKAMT